MPMHFERKYVVFFQEQIIPFEGLLDQGGVILAGDTNQNAGTGERRKELLV